MQVANRCALSPTVAYLSLLTAASPPRLPVPSGGLVPDYAFKGEGLCLTANGKELPYYYQNGSPKNDKSAYCSSQCTLAAGCAGFRYIPSKGYCKFYGAAFTKEDTPGGGGWGFYAGTGGTGPITQVSSYSGLYTGQYCYARAAAVTTATTQPGKVAP